jgi:hypothetical protein
MTRHAHPAGAGDLATALTTLNAAIDAYASRDDAAQSAPEWDWLIRDGNRYEADPQCEGPYPSREAAIESASDCCDEPTEIALGHVRYLTLEDLVTAIDPSRLLDAAAAGLEDDEGWTDLVDCLDLRDADGSACSDLAAALDPWFKKWLRLTPPWMVSPIIERGRILEDGSYERTELLVRDEPDGGTR